MSTVTIIYYGPSGNEDITHDVLYESVSFESQLGAIPGAFEITVKDLTRTHDFITGREISLDIDGSRYFGGFITQVTRQLAFPVDDTSNISTVRTRQWVLRGVDYNIAFDKRVIYNKASPTEAPATFSGTTTDLAALTTFLADYIDIDDLDLDTTTFVEEVGDPTPDGSRGAYMNPGDPWRKQMESFAAFTGAIWYIDASKNLHYQALETASPVWGFSDVPNNVTTFGFRDMEYVEDATNLANDALVWGGSEFGSSGTTKRTVFGEVENTTSISVHGRWQITEPHFNEVGYFETTGVQIRANTIVRGSPGADAGGDQNRGLQNPQKNIRLTWFSGHTPTSLTAGSVVTVTLNVFGGGSPIVVALPVRSISITFPIPTVAKFQAFLGIQTSDPWSLWKYLRQAARARVAIAGTVTSDGTTTTVSGAIVSMEPTPTPDGSNKDFFTTDIYVAGTTRVYLFPTGAVGGALQRLGIDYLESSPTSKKITFITAPANTSSLWMTYIAA